MNKSNSRLAIAALVLLTAAIGCYYALLRDNSEGIAHTQATNVLSPPINRISTSAPSTNSAQRVAVSGFDGVFVNIPASTSDVLKNQKAPLYTNGKWVGEEVSGISVSPVIETGACLVQGRLILPPYRLVRIGNCLFLNSELIAVADVQHGSPPGNKEELKNFFANAVRAMESDSILPIYRSEIHETLPLKTELDVLANENLTDDTLEWARIVSSSKTTEEKHLLLKSLSTKNMKSESELNTAMRVLWPVELNEGSKCADNKHLPGVVEKILARKRSRPNRETPKPIDTLPDGDRK